MYITLAEAKTLLKRILDPYKTDNVVDDDHLQLVIDESEGMINAAIGSRYNIPVTGTNAVSFIRSLVVPILRYKTYTQFADTVEISDGIIAEYKSTLKVLDQLAQQVISLPDTTEKTTGRPSHIKISISPTVLDGY